MAILTINAGSSSIKMGIFDAACEPVMDASVQEIGGRAILRDAHGARPVEAADHLSALDALLGAAAAHFPLAGITAVAHRVVHGGESLTRTVRVTEHVLDAIARAVPLAPLHNPANLAAIRATRFLLPDLDQFASFDTAFHATNAEIAVRYALPDRVTQQGIRRYGFHGISYAALTRRLAEARVPRTARRVLALHLGNGASLCGIVDDRSVATTMGYSPLEGLTMGTRTGSIDGNAVLRMARLYGIEGAGRILNRESGLTGLGGTNDMRALHAAGTPEAAFAVAHFIYWAVRHSGGMIAAMGGLDAIAFTGGIGENDPVVRAGILDGLAFMGARYDAAANASSLPELHAAGAALPIWVVKADEERQIAMEALDVIDRERRP